MATQANGLLAVWTDVAPEAEREFNEEYSARAVIWLSKATRSIWRSMK